MQERKNDIFWNCLYVSNTVNGQGNQIELSELWSIHVDEHTSKWNVLPLHFFHNFLFLIAQTVLLCKRCSKMCTIKRMQKICKFHVVWLVSVISLICLDEIVSILLSVDYAAWWKNKEKKENNNNVNTADHHFAN